MITNMYQLYYIIIIIIIQQNFALKFVKNEIENGAQIQLSDGRIQGRIKSTRDTGLTYYAFEGIPYAKPPVGNFRFKPPQPPDPWDGVLDANGDVPICIQIPPKSKNYVESEDCLYINVYTPKISNESKLAVMVWIYGGGFLFGQALSSYYGPDYLLEHDVIVVHFNYRINAFGFLSTEDLESPGNYGLKDQQLALKWVYENIEKFGGDPNKITIFGESAGAASVQYQLLSPTSSKYFQKAISESGSVLCPWAFQPNPRKVAMQLGLLLGINTNSSKTLIEKLRQIEAKKLTSAAIKIVFLHTLNIMTTLPFSPTMEPEHETAFLTKNSFESLQNGEFPRIPYIVGLNSEELELVKPGLQIVEPFLQLLTLRPEILVPPDMNADDEVEAGIQIKRFYFNKFKNDVSQFITYMSDSYFNRPITKAISFLSQHLPLFMYKFSYEGYNLGRKALSFGEDQNLTGAMHSEEIWYLFAREDLKSAEPRDELIRNRMTKLWTNFAKFDSPTPETDELFENIIWPLYNNSDKKFLEINTELSVNQNNKKSAMEFWDNLYRDYGQPPYTTY